MNRDLKIEWKEGRLCHSARLNSRKTVSIGDETHPGNSQPITTFPVITSQVSETDFHTTSAQRIGEFAPITNEV